jgi:hypothetical protein
VTVEFTVIRFVFIPNDILLTSQLARRQEYINDLVQIRDQYLEEYQESAWHGGYLKSMALLTSPFEMKKNQTGDHPVVSGFLRSALQSGKPETAPGNDPDHLSDPRLSLGLCHLPLHGRI